MLARVAAWGSNPDAPPDFDNDGTVGILDLLTLLAAGGYTTLVYLMLTTMRRSFMMTVRRLAGTA